MIEMHRRKDDGNGGSFYGEPYGKGGLHEVGAPLREAERLHEYEPSAPKGLKARKAPRTDYREGEVCDHPP